MIDKILTGIIVLIAVMYVGRFFYRKRKTNKCGGCFCSEECSTKNPGSDECGEHKSEKPDPEE